MSKTKLPSSSDKNHLRLVQVHPKSFAGISEDQQLVVMFPENENVMIAHGDQGTGKSSLLECIKYALTGERPVNATNRTDKTEDVNFVFKDKDGVEIQIRATKTSFNIFRIENPGTSKENRFKVESPKQWLRRNVGEIGVDPAGLRSMKPELQVKWIRSMVNMDETQLAQEQKINDNIKKTTTTRKQVNGVRTTLKKRLLASGYYAEKVKHGKELKDTARYKEDKDKYKEDAKERHQNAMAVLDEVNGLKTEKGLKDQELAQQKARLDLINKEIAELEEKLRIARDMQAKTTDAINSIELVLADEKYNDLDIRAEEARKNVDSINEYITEQTAFQAIETDKELYDKSVTTYDELDAALQNLNRQRELFIQQLTPAIEGLELCISSEVDVKEELKQYKEDNEDATEEQIAAEQDRLEKMNRDGIYVNGKTVYELSESELLAFCIKCWEYAGVRMLVIENLSSYGSDAVKTINEFAKAGAQVFASLMERGKDKMAISFYPQIPEKI